MKNIFLSWTSAIALSFALTTYAAAAEKKHMDGEEMKHMGSEEMKHDEEGDDHGSFAFGAPGMAKMASRTIKISMKDMAYSLAELKVKEGETIRFIITNNDEADHEFTLGPKEMQAEHRMMMEKMMDEDMEMKHGDPNAVSIPEGQVKELVWKFGEPAHIEFACNIPGHYEAGMKGEIMIMH
jgi:uncharacterized cupredoxin-like copper-binding protein